MRNLMLGADGCDGGHGSGATSCIAARLLHSLTSRLSMQTPNVPRMRLWVGAAPSSFFDISEMLLDRSDEWPSKLVRKFSVRCANVRTDATGFAAASFCSEISSMCGSNAVRSSVVWPHSAARNSSFCPLGKSVSCWRSSGPWLGNEWRTARG